MGNGEMDKSDLDFLLSSQDLDLLYKHLIKAIIHSAKFNKVGYNRYAIDELRIHILTEYAVYNERAFILNVGRLDKYAVEI